MTEYTKTVTQISEHVVHVSYTKPGYKTSEHLVQMPNSDEKKQVKQKFQQIGDDISFLNDSGKPVLLQNTIEFIPKKVYTYQQSSDEDQVKSTANGDVSVIENLIEKSDHDSFSGKITFSINSEEILTGLGQYEDGIYNYHGRKEYIYESNMRIGIPFLISSNNYGILIDTQSSVIFDSETDYMTFTIDTTNDVSYYVITGKNVGTILKNLRQLTGKAIIPPRWAFGYMQSKERYENQDELVSVATKFREDKIPVDCIIQDWHTWIGDHWGEKLLDKKRYPNFTQGMKALHDINTKLLFSIWPNMANNTKDFQEFKKEGLLLPNSNTYDAFSDEGRKLYWQQCDREIFNAGADGWWCDNSEPFSDEDWDGAKRRKEQNRYDLVVNRSKKSMNWDQINSYSLYHAKGIYENWLKTNSKKRVVNLTRSTMIGAQKYGVIPWSGDQSARWDVLDHQVTEGIKMALSGMPYWTFDIGGFFTVKDKWENRGCGMAGNDTPFWYWNGDYNDGVEDDGFKELYTRWLQVGTFIPIFRSHGTDTPREPWQFGKPGEPFYDAIVKFIKLRYRLLPYIYSWAANAYFDDETIMRGFLFDFANDEIAKNIDNEYMFGDAFLVRPVTKPMYYKPNSEKIPVTDYSSTVYLPKGTKWYDFWSNEVAIGGQTVDVSTPIDKMPIFVKAGSIIPTSDEIQYADQKQGKVNEITIYAGADGEFKLYNDDGDNYSYENGNYSRIFMNYQDEGHKLILDQVIGNGNFQKEFRIHLIGENIDRLIDVHYDGSEQEIGL